MVVLVPFQRIEEHRLMTMITHTYVDGAYKSRVYDNHMVEVEHDGILIDWPGPWDTHEGARAWAEAIVTKYASDGHTS